MSKVAISGNASGTGVFTLAAPNSNTDRTLTLPDEAGTVLTTAGVPASAMPAGSVLQVVSATSNTTISSTTPQPLLTLSITPSSSSNKILILATAGIEGVHSTNSYVVLFVKRAGTTLMQQYTGQGGTSTTVWSSLSLTHLDSPATTSSISYSVDANTGSGGTSSWSTAGNYYSFTLMEIAG